jgi:2,5-diketo-D-gluconate reductase A
VTKTVSFANGGEIPVIGFGTWQITGRTCVDAVRAALRSGYRHVDTATMYGNEAEVGAAWRDSGLPRDDVFLTTKLPPRLAGQARRTLEQSLRSLGTDHVDLWLIHWPPGGADASAALWAEFIKARDAGLTRYIGVSNYSPAEIDLLAATGGEAPVLNQIPFGPNDWDADLVAAHVGRGVAVEGYSGFKRTDLRAPALVAAARAHGVTVPQVVVRWHVQHDVVVIPKSKTPEEPHQPGRSHSSAASANPSVATPYRTTGAGTRRAITGPSALPPSRPTARGTVAARSIGPAVTKTTADADVPTPRSMFLTALASGSRSSTATSSTVSSMIPDPAPK